MDVKNVFAMRVRSSEVVPVVDEPLHQEAGSTRDERCVEQVRDTTSALGGVSVAGTVVEKSVWNMWSTRSLTAHAVWVHDATLEPSIVTLASYVDLLTRFQRGVPDERATHGCEERVCRYYIHRCVEGEEPCVWADTRVVVTLRFGGTPSQLSSSPEAEAEHAQDQSNRSLE